METRQSRIKDNNNNLENQHKENGEKKRKNEESGLNHQHQLKKMKYETSSIIDDKSGEIERFTWHKQI